jgi:hypothetical protein
MKNTFNKKLTSITLTILLSSLSHTASSAGVDMVLKQQTLNIAKKEIEQSLQKMVAEVTTQLSSSIKNEIKIPSYIINSPSR